MKKIALLLSLACMTIYGCEAGPDFSQYPVSLTTASVSSPAAAPTAQGITGVPLAAPLHTITVTALTDLQKALSAAHPGDEIILADGTYDSPGPITIPCTGTAAHPILIRAASLGGAEIKGKAGFVFDKSAAWVIVENFKFTHSSVPMMIPPEAKRIRITRNEFALVNDAGRGKEVPTIPIYGDDCEIDHNFFHDKHTEGCWVTVQGPGKDGMAQRAWIHHNEFNNFMPTENNCSAIQVGLSGRSLSSGHALIEYNLFIKCHGENEGMVCNKSCDNIYRYNTITDGTRELSLRHGNRCQVYGNYFLNVDGIRFFGHDHLIFSNYFQGCERAINIGNGDGIVPQSKLTSHDKPVGEIVAFNTLVNNKANIVQQGRRNGLGADHITIANNIIYGGPQVADTSGPITNPTWQNNLAWKTTSGLGNAPASGITTANPNLKEVAGIYTLQSPSPAEGKATGTFPFVTVDLHGQPRITPLTIGAEQPSDAPSINRPLTEKDVGPLAK